MKDRKQYDRERYLARKNLKKSNISTIPTDNSTIPTDNSTIPTDISTISTIPDNSTIPDISTISTIPSYKLIETDTQELIILDNHELDECIKKGEVFLKRKIVLKNII